MVYGIRSKIAVHVFSTNIDPNDFVLDTVPVKRPNFGCPSPKKSCVARDFTKKDDLTFFTANDANSTNLDPVTNYMDYGDDGCMNNFSPMQVERMKAMWALRRADQ